MNEPTPATKLSSTKRLALIVGGGALAVFGGAYVAGYALAGDNVPKNASVSGVVIGGLTRDAAIQKLESELAPRLTKPVVLTAGEAKVTFVPSEVGLGIDYATSVTASGAGRSWAPLHILTVLAGGGESRAVVTESGEALAQAVETLAKKADVAARDAGIAVKGGKLVRSKGADGITVDRPATLGAIADDFLTGQVAAVVKRTEPEITTAEADSTLTGAGTAALAHPIKVDAGEAGDFDLTPKMLAAALRFVPTDGALAPVLDAKKLTAEAKTELKGLGLKQPKDADITISKGKPKIIPSVDGIGIDSAELATAAQRVLAAGAGRTVTVKAGVQQAAFTTADAKKMGVKQVTGKFTTYYPGSAYRVNNLGKAARLINGTFLKPGETFSMNKTLGFRSAANGWMSGGAIDGGIVTQRMGGGISQATTTTFNAIFFAGLKDIYHKPHSLYFSRYPVGREATLDWVSVDMKFQNDSPHGVVLQAWTTGKVGQTGSITVRVWSTKRYTVKASKPVRSNYRAPAATRYDTSAGCEPQSAMSGFDVRYKRLFYQGNKLVRSEPFFWRYNTLTPVVCGKKPGS
ncbi:MAG: VanW family protein [Micropruina sp.]